MGPKLPRSGKNIPKTPQNYKRITRNCQDLNNHHKKLWIFFDLLSNLPKANGDEYG